MAELTLIVSEGSPTARQLWQVLADDGISAQVRTPTAVLDHGWPVDTAPDVLLVDAALDVVTTRSLVERISASADRPPAVVSFADSDSPSLASHVREGREYLLGPFHPHLVRGRLATSRHYRDMSLVLGESDAAARRSGLERELQIGREIQQGFLPETLPVIDGWELSAWFEPARVVSGDFYDAYDVINGEFVAFAIADVCDKGIGAALFMALIRSLLRQAACADEGTLPAAVGGGNPDPLASTGLALRAVRRTNDYLTANHLHQAYFATLFFGVVDPRNGELVYINGGHNPPILRRADGRVSWLKPTGPALGLMEEAHFELGRQRLLPGDLLFLYTDGVPESKSADGAFLGEERMQRLLAEGGTAHDVVERFGRAVDAHSGSAEQFDDVTMLGLRRRPLPAPTATPSQPSEGAVVGGS